MRYAVDPTELTAVAEDVAVVGSLVGQAGERLAACSAGGWCPDERLRSDVEVALAELQYAAQRAGRAADATVAVLRVAARRYQRVNAPEPE